MDNQGLRDGVAALMTPVRQVTAVMRFRAGPGREDEAAAAWAFELTYFFLRGVGERPQVSYDDDVYTVSGLMQTTHPGDRSPVTVFNGGEAHDLDGYLDPGRQRTLRELVRHAPWFDGRDYAGREQHG